MFNNVWYFNSLEAGGATNKYVLRVYKKKRFTARWVESNQCAQHECALFSLLLCLCAVGKQSATPQVSGLILHETTFRVMAQSLGVNVFLLFNSVKQRSNQKLMGKNTSRMNIQSWGCQHQDLITLWSLKRGSRWSVYSCCRRLPGGVLSSL